MSVAALREAFSLLRRMPVLWVPGLAAGFFTAVLWIVLALYGMFFASRLLVICGLVNLFFVTGMLFVVRNNGGGLPAMLGGGTRYYLRVLLPQLVILAGILFVFGLVVLAFILAGYGSENTVMASLTFGIMIPTVILTFFYDCAAVFEDKRVFASVQRSIDLVWHHMNEVTVFFLVSAALFIGWCFVLMFIWEAALFERLEPISRYTEAQIQAFTPEQFIALIGPDGTWITAAVLFLGVFLLVPLLFTYKACFFKTLLSSTPVVQQVATGEFDSKGRWYRY